MLGGSEYPFRTGPATLENLGRIRAPEYFSFLAQFDTPKLRDFSVWPAKVVREIGYPAPLFAV